MAKLIRVDGTTEMLPNADLDTLQKAVGGYIEVVTLADGRLLIVDEEGKCKGKPVNPTANTIFNVSYDVIVGDAVLCDNDEMK